MPYDDHDHSTVRPSLTAAVADLMAVDTLRADDAAMLAALRAAIAETRDPVATLWDEYRGGRPASLRGLSGRTLIRPSRAPDPLLSLRRTLWSGSQRVGRDNLHPQRSP